MSCNHIYFNSHPHEEDDQLCKDRDIECKPFQLTSSRGGWPQQPFHPSVYCYFNSHPHEEDDAYALSVPPHPLTFQLTSSRGGWHRTTMGRIDKVVFQLTSSRGGWPCSFHLEFLFQYFNSHPHEEDDYDDEKDNSPHEIFQLTSSRGGWQVLPFVFICTEHFNSHPHEEDDDEDSDEDDWEDYFNSHHHEEDDYLPSKFPRKDNISTHILTRRMTGRNNSSHFP